jgi:hypothetical protein
MSPKPVDAIIVPTARPGNRLGQPARLAETLNCTLVMMCSGSAAASDVIAAERPGGLDLVAVDFGTPATSRAIPLETTALLSGTDFERHGDVSAKRNTALLLAYYAGWERIFFLDDDISVAEPEDLRQAAGLLDKYAAVGLRITGFPDGSVATHAHMELGGQQRDFLAGGALALAPRQRPSFFPQVYNDDWLYLIDDAGLPRLALTGSAAQEAYDPFANPGRAASEEFGEVVVIGLYYLARSGRRLRDADDEYWSAFLRQRDDLLAGLLARIRARRRSPAERKIEAALLSARDSLALITPLLCSAYVGAWLRDRDRWTTLLRRLPTNLPIQAALAETGLSRLSPPARTDVRPRHASR